FITVDGAEGGTGAAPLEFSNSVGMPCNDGLNLVHGALVGTGLRGDVKLFAAGKITSGFHILSKMALGADACNSARAMMFALGCIQALKCNTNMCPTGVATNNKNLVHGLVVPDKAARVHSFHAKTVHSVGELLGAAGLRHPRDLRPELIYRRVSMSEIRTFAELYPVPAAGSLLAGDAPAGHQAAWFEASPEWF
ncbi:MAG: FMN-binding glutamate synthase family protein, partial [Myxococcales bacterium]|nr:FMN-binding glutamate synthase family protein [Myxococcales bacterium]